MTEIANKTAFVTGAASGIGLALTKALLARGAKVMMADMNAKGLKSCLLYTSPSPRDGLLSRMPSSA